MAQTFREAVETHGLRCPKCDEPMTTYERSGVTVDRCRACRGIFLDRGELERITDAEAAPGPARFDPRDAGGGWDPEDEAGSPYEGSAHERDGRTRTRRRGGFLGDLLEGFGD